MKGDWGQWNIYQQHFCCRQVVSGEDGWDIFSKCCCLFHVHNMKTLFTQDTEKKHERDTTNFTLQGQFSFHRGLQAIVWKQLYNVFCGVMMSSGLSQPGLETEANNHTHYKKTYNTFLLFLMLPLDATKKTAHSGIKWIIMSNQEISCPLSCLLTLRKTLENLSSTSAELDKEILLMSCHVQ